MFTLALLFLMQVTPVELPSFSISQIMTERAALRKAETIWGGSARVQKVNKPGRLPLYQVGCHFPTEHPHMKDFVVAGEGITWEDAFAAVDMRMNGKRVFSDGKITIFCNAKIT